LERGCWMLARAIVNHEKLDLSTTGLPEVSKASTTEPVSIKSPAGKPTKKSPLPAALEDDGKASPAPDKNKDAGKDSEKKKDAAGNSEKKKDAADPDKKKDDSSAKPENKN
jgi:hypothetical protein